VDFGAFVDLDGIDGLIHISELSWSHVNHPSEVLTIGQKVEVRVLDIDRDRQRISLGLKQTQKDPWQQVFENRQVNEIVHGRVTKLVSFGAFVEIEEGVEGLIHISELAQHHVEDPSEIVRPGQEVNVKIIEIDPERRRLSLSLKRLEPEYRIHEDAFAEEAVEEGEEGEEFEEAAEETAEEAAAEDAVAEEPAAEGVKAPETEPAAEAEPVAEGEPAEEAEPAAEAEPTGETEPIEETEPTAEAEPVVEAEPEDGGSAEAEPASELGEETPAEEAGAASLTKEED
jgi:small subunit ribosomal protein S1